MTVELHVEFFEPARLGFMFVGSAVHCFYIIWPTQFQQDCHTVLELHLYEGKLGHCRTHLMCFPSLKDHSTLQLSIQCLIFIFPVVSSIFSSVITVESSKSSPVSVTLSWMKAEFCAI